MVSMSKGLGAPGGSLLAGRRDLIAAAVRYRRMLGGAMRQAGHFAAAAEYALDNNLQRLAEDHDRAKRLGRSLAQCSRIRIDADAIQTNVVVFDLAGADDPLEPATRHRAAPDAHSPDAHALVAAARARGVLLNAMSGSRLRLLTHLDASDDDCRRAAGILVEVAQG